MRGPKRRDIQRARDKLKTAELCLAGYTQLEIASEIGVSREQIKYDLKQIKKEWKNSGLQDFDEKIRIELVKIERVENEAWTAWLRSQEKRNQKYTNFKKDPKVPASSTKIESEQNGDPRFLDTVLKCIERRCKLLGLDEPTKLQVSTHEQALQQLDEEDAD